MKRKEVAAIVADIWSDGYQAGLEAAVMNIEKISAASKKEERAAIENFAFEIDTFVAAKKHKDAEEVFEND